MKGETQSACYLLTIKVIRVDILGVPFAQFVHSPSNMMSVVGLQCQF